MAILYSAETAPLGTTQPQLRGFTYGGKIRRYTATITLAAQANADWILLARLRPGEKFIGGAITSSVSLATSVIAIGTNATHASNGQYRAAGTFTAVDTPTPFGLASAKSANRQTAETDVFLTSATAALPASGTLVIEIDVLAA